jgi:uncharacterized protein YdeI (YjbR/CyaY-like superfamily)
MSKNQISQFCPANEAEWRDWLEQHHTTEKGVWLVIYKKSSGKENLSWSEAVDQALCFGWIDSLAKTIDYEKYKQYYSPRKPQSIWSKINKDKVNKLISEGMMAEAGLKSVDVAKENGTWTIFDSAERLEIPEDLELAFERVPGSKLFFQEQKKMLRRSMLGWIATAKREETRKRRIDEIVETARKGELPKRYR